jgi:O-antigen/teichoic acid export membrane protein
MTDRYRVVCACGQPRCPYSAEAIRRRNNHRKEPAVKNFLVRVMSDLWLTATMLVLLSVAAMLDPYGPWYWTTLVAYAVQCVYGYYMRRRPSWRRKDSRTTDGDERG